MNYLKRWIILNPKYKIQGIENIIPDDMINLPTYKIEDIKNINSSLIKVFDDASKMNPEDPDLLVHLFLLSPLLQFYFSLKDSMKFLLIFLIVL
jgi:hypothetical protein